tara:strand:+ start:47 stop:553 length:507 start_codon:yes stop_codon:yes gene_type:complete
MDSNLKKQLNKLVKEYKSEETTDKIRQLKHSELIYKDVQKILNLKKQYSRLEKTNKEQFKQIATNHCSFLVDNYTNLFIKLLKNQLDLNLLLKFINILKEIENGKLDQHEGSYKVGTILKKLYIDSAISNEKDKKPKKKIKKKPKLANKKLSWKDYKKSDLYNSNNSE